MLGHCKLRPLGELVGFFVRVLVSVTKINVLGDVAQWIMGLGLVGDDVNGNSTAEQFWEQSGRVANQPNGKCFAVFLSIQYEF